MGCLKAFLKPGFEREFYDLGHVGYWGPQSKKEVDFHFDGTRKLDAQARDLRNAPPCKREVVKACGNRRLAPTLRRGLLMVRCCG